MKMALKTAFNMFLVAVLPFMLCTEPRIDQSASSDNRTSYFNYTGHRRILSSSEHWNHIQTFADDVLSKSMPISLVTFPSMQLTPDCEDAPRTPTAYKGVIFLNESTEDCKPSWCWEVRAPLVDYGTVLQFHDINLLEKGTMEVLTSDGDSDWTIQRSFTSKEPGKMDFSPLLLSESLVRVSLSTSPKVTCQTALTRRLNITYAFYLKARLPKQTTVLSNVSTSTSRWMYDCSGDAFIPSVLRCNMVQQCLLNEDEENCDYKKRGCGDWIPYRDQCLKIEFVANSTTDIGKPFATYPSEAEDTCRSHYGSSLALLPDSAGIRLVGNAIRQSGFQSAVIGIKRVKPVFRKLRRLYKFLWQWGAQCSQIAYEQQQIQRDGPLVDCGTLDVYPDFHLSPLRCILPDDVPDGYVCMKPNAMHPGIKVSRPLEVAFSAPRRLLDRIPTKACSGESRVLIFENCDRNSGNPAGWSPNSFYLFPCLYGPPVHYALVCDGSDDCTDGSDELDCVAPRFAPLKTTTFECDNSQIIPESLRCNGLFDCLDDSDEDHCKSCTNDNVLCTGLGCMPQIYARLIQDCPDLPEIPKEDLVSYHPAVVSLDGYGMSALHPVDYNDLEGLFRCNNEYYIPSFLLNNGELDCQFGEDEGIATENITCPGYYRCQIYNNCLHPKYVCDGINHCPNKDDEKYCDISCPDGCVCEGYAFRCRRFASSSEFLLARYIDLSTATNISLIDIHILELLQYFNLSNCRLSSIKLTDMPQLRNLDLSFNELKNLSSVIFEGLTGLRHLDLSGNLLVGDLDSTFSSFVQHAGLNGLNYLTLRNTGIEAIQNRVLSAFTKLKKLDIRGNEIKFYKKDIFWGLPKFKELLTDDHKLCCPYFRQNLAICLAPSNELSSCTDLLRSDFFRVCLWLLSFLALVGNAGVLLYRARSSKHSASANFRLLTSNLCAADFLMGVYMMIIGIADARFSGMYAAKEKYWRQSFACTVAGFLGFVSSEVSALLILVITLERLVVLRFPLKAKLHFKSSWSMVVCGMVWVLGIMMAGLPLYSSLDYDFYGETSICLPLPITRRQFRGRNYAFGVFIVFNFIIFLLIGASQALIYNAVRRAARATGVQRRSQETVIARRLFLVVFTDFCCWFPVGIMGLLAAGGVPIPDEVNVWTAIFVLPVNSALNPFLYTLNAAMEKRKARNLKIKTRKLLTDFQAELPRMHPDMAEEFVRICICSKLVKKERMLQWLQNDYVDSKESHSPQTTTTEKSEVFLSNEKQSDSTL